MISGWEVNQPFPAAPPRDNNSDDNHDSQPALHVQDSDAFFANVPVSPRQPPHDLPDGSLVPDPEPHEKPCQGRLEDRLVKLQGVGEDFLSEDEACYRRPTASPLEGTTRRRSGCRDKHSDSGR